MAKKTLKQAEFELTKELLFIVNSPEELELLLGDLNQYHEEDQTEEVSSFAINIIKSIERRIADKDGK